MARLDELHAHQYTRQRMVNALVRHDPDPPARSSRSVLLVLVGAIIAAVLALAILVFNQVTGHGIPSKWDSSTVFIEKESGAQYVYTKTDNQLHPVLNYASGLLVADGTGKAPTTARRNRLAALRRETDVQIGATLGIPDAPNAPPRPGDLIRDAWQVCTRSGDDGATPRTDLLIGAGAVTGGHALTGPGSGSAGEALLVQPPDNRVYLVFNGRKFFLDDAAVAAGAFGWSGRRPVSVAAGWLNALPTGPDIKTLKIDGLGQPSQVRQIRIGTLYRGPAPDGHQWAVVQRDRVQPISEVQARLVQADLDVEVADVGAAEFIKLIRDQVSDPGQDQLPQVVPALVSIASSACVRIPDATTGASAVIIDPSATAAGAPAPRTAGRAVRADRISVPFGHGVLVRAVPSPTAPAGIGTVSVVTASGIRYPIADSTATTRLGYGDTTPLSMPAEVVTLLPAGPALSTSAALHSW